MTGSIDERLSTLEQLMQGLSQPWAMLSKEIDTRISDLTKQLINNDSEQTRGRIKALLDIKDLPATLRNEYDGLKAALSEQDAGY